MAYRNLGIVAGQSRDALVGAITVDTFGVDEQLTAFLTVFDEEVMLPCTARLLDIDVEVLGFDIEGDERRGLVARCRRVGGRLGVVSLVDVRFASGTVAAWLHAAFRAWLDLEPFPSQPPEDWSWPAR